MNDSWEIRESALKTFEGDVVCNHCKMYFDMAAVAGGEKGFEFGKSVTNFVLYHSSKRCMEERNESISKLEELLTGMNQIIVEGDNEKYRDYCKDFFSNTLVGMIGFDVTTFEDKDTPEGLPRLLFDLCYEANTLVCEWMHIYSDNVYDVVKLFEGWAGE